jgi:hypothetical protein
MVYVGCGKNIWERGLEMKYFWIMTKYGAVGSFNTREEAEARRQELLAERYDTPLPWNKESNPKYYDYELWIEESDTKPKSYAQKLMDGDFNSKVPTILFRTSDFDSEQEKDAATKYFPVETNRTKLKDSLVVGRYSVLPYYRELEEDLKVNRSVLINTWEQFNYVANFDYYEDIEGYTFKTWFDHVGNIPLDEAGPFVVKGRTNSRKQDWKTLMYAADRKEAIRIQSELFKDPFIGQQGLIFRKFDDTLKVLGTSEITGQPYTHEWRVFFYRGKPLGGAYYWSVTAPDEITKNTSLPTAAILFVDKIGKIIGQKTNFYAIDIAERNDGSWVVVEVNDGQMAGLPTAEIADTMYGLLGLEIRKQGHESLPQYT